MSLGEQTNFPAPTKGWCSKPLHRFAHPNNIDPQATNSAFLIYKKLERFPSFRRKPESGVSRLRLSPGDF
jgi:hypothetical protein